MNYATQSTTPNNRSKRGQNAVASLKINRSVPDYSERLKFAERIAKEMDNE